MDELISILIADDNAEFGNVLNEYLNQCDGMAVKGVARDGIEAISMIRELAPELVILDLIMPNLDGIGVLERISGMQLKKRPVFIVLTAVGQDSIIQKAIELGAEYYILKPFDINMLVARIRQIYNEKNSSQFVNMEIAAGRAGGAEGFRSPDRLDMEQVVTGYIKSMGITPNIAGYHYLREAVIKASDHPVLHQSVLKYIYIGIANRHHTTAKSIERAIRCAVESAYKRNQFDKPDAWNPDWGCTGGNRPNNFQIISCLANKAKARMNATK